MTVFSAACRGLYTLPPSISSHFYVLGSRFVFMFVPGHCRTVYGAITIGGAVHC
jgi:hypothetical protein